jgi:pimeloyl-ACP methyl ester carboxylesterase
MSDAAQHN